MRYFGLRVSRGIKFGVWIQILGSDSKFGIWIQNLGFGFMPAGQVEQAVFLVWKGIRVEG